MKNIKSLLAAAFLFAFCCFSASAGSVAVQVIQNGASNDTVNACSYLVENTVLDTFFENGYVITNSPIAIAKNNVEKLESKALDEAFEGQIDQLLFLTIDFKENGSTNPDALLLANIKSISWKVVDVITREVLGSGQYTVQNVNSANNSSNGIKRVVESLSLDAYGVLRSAR